MTTDQPYSEAELIRRVRRGHRDAQYLLYKKYVRAMYHLVIRMVADHAEAQDIVQDSFVKVFEKIGTYREDATLGAWIKRIVINMAINSIRKKKRSLPFNEEIDEQALAAIPEPEGPGEIDPAFIHKAVRQLPEGCRVIVNLYAFEGYSHKEIAQILEVSESTSKTQYRRAKSLLRKSLGENTETL